MAWTHGTGRDSDVAVLATLLACRCNGMREDGRWGGGGGDYKMAESGEGRDLSGERRWCVWVWTYLHARALVEVNLGRVAPVSSLLP